MIQDPKKKHPKAPKVSSIQSSEAQTNPRHIFMHELMQNPI